MKKKSQMEIMGLVIIVILITLGLFFIVRFMIARQPSEIKLSYTRTETAANILNSLLKTTSEDCYGMTVKDLLVDSAENMYSNNHVICENGENSTAYVLNIIEQVFDETLIKWGDQNFDFRATVGSTPILNSTHNGCPGEKEAKQFYIPTDVGLMTINLEVC